MSNIYLNNIYFEGYYAFEDGKLKWDNPYVDIIDNIDWERGWLAAQSYEWENRIKNV